MNIEPKDIIRIANDLDNAITNSEKFAVPILAIRAKKGALNNPGDETLRLMYNVLSKMSENNKLFISRGELRDIYSKFSSNRSKASELFKDELAFEAPKEMNRKTAGEKDEKPFDIYFGADQTVLNAFSSLWDENGKVAKVAEYKSYNPKIAEQANILTSFELSRLGVRAKQIKTFAGTDKFILCDAVCETSKGDVHIVTPVEICNGSALMPVMFINKHGFIDLNKETIKTHFDEFAGKNFAVNSEKIFETLHTASKIECLDELSLQVLAIQNAMKGDKEVYASTNDLMLAIPEGKEDLIKAASTGDFVSYNNVLSKLYEATELKANKADVEKLSSYLESSKGSADFTFGKDIVDNGRAVIANQIKGFGYKSQVKVVSNDEDSITYAVAINTRNGPLGFEVISEVNNGKTLLPSIMAVQDKPYNFSKEGLDRAIDDKVSDTKVLAIVSPLYELKNSEVASVVKKATASGDYQTAEEALNVLAEKADYETYALALGDYMSALGGITKSACEKEECKCTRIVKSSSREQPLCGHLNLPLNQVYQDKYGNCVPKYRKNMSDTYEGLLFNTSKMFS